MLDDGKYKLLIDPFITGNPTSPYKSSDLTADFIALTHAHGDHLGDAITIAKRDKSQLITVNELGNYLVGLGLNAHKMHIGGAYNFPFGRLKFTIAHHGSCGPDGQYMGETCRNCHQNGEEKTIYHCGDTGLFLGHEINR